MVYYKSHVFPLQLQDPTEIIQYSLIMTVALPLQGLLHLKIVAWVGGPGRGAG